MKEKIWKNEDRNIEFMSNFFLITKKEAWENNTIYEKLKKTIREKIKNILIILFFYIFYYLLLYFIIFPKWKSNELFFLSRWH